MLGLTWDQWGIILEVFVIAGTGILAFIGYSRIKRKKGALKRYMADIDAISAAEYEDPMEYEQKLNEVEGRINEEFLAGKIEDLHFHMLQDIIISRRAEIRRATISQKFEKLPEGIEKDLDEMLRDGKISREEYESFVATISMTKSLTPDQKKELSRMIGKWEVEDKDIIAEEHTHEKDKFEKSEIEEDFEDEFEYQDEEENLDEE
jgi:hypothetical protein